MQSKARVWARWPVLQATREEAWSAREWVNDMPIETRAFKCSFCGAKYYRISKATVTKHERTCWHNPERRACKTCEHYDNEQEEGYYAGTNEFCEHFEEFLNMGICHECEAYKEREGMGE